MTLTPLDLARIDRYERDLEFIKARQAEVGRDAERERLWVLVVETGMPPSMLAQLIEREKMEREQEDEHRANNP